MRLRPLLVLVACALTGCSDSTTAPEVAPLVGAWQVAPYLSRDGTTYEQSLTLRGDQTYVRDWRIYAASGAGRRGDLFAYITTEGTFTVRGDSIFMRAILSRNWDRDFFGGVERVTPVNSSGVYGQGGARFEIIGETLVLHFLSYPADAPVETTESLVRVR
jgi:hypothetical protein